MKKTIVTIGTVTHAIKAKKLLMRVGLSSKLIKVGGAYSNEGCAYGLELEGEDFYSAVIELRKADINYSLYTK